MTGGDCDEGPPVDLSAQLGEGSSVNEVGWLGALVEFLAQPDRGQRVSAWWRDLIDGARASLKSNRTYDRKRMSRDQKDFATPRKAPRTYDGTRLSRDQKDYQKASVLETDSSGNINIKAKKSDGTKLSRDQKDYPKARSAPAYDVTKMSRDQKHYQ